ncbi:pentatricopeptide repeat-containing protein At1g08070, chloroplastic-like [Musa acuminata AAA Group]|uniref:pentatricopeptide repeat-containing protein At1g08070, chloroplastic-like n=1 Tax=Musa acuminata AAA Group TaxID=214697 RepID=UPI0031D2A9BE
MSTPLPQHQLFVPSRPQRQRGSPRATRVRGRTLPALLTTGRAPEGNNPPPDPTVNFHRLLSSGALEPEHIAFPSLFKTCCGFRAAEEGRQLHGQAVKRGLLLSDVFVQRSLLRMYARFLACDDALKVFERCSQPDIVSCNDLIVGLCRIGDLDAARKVFDGMADRNVVSWSVMVDGYSRNGSLGIAQELFDAMPERNQFCWNSLISGYLRCGHVEVARRIFDRMRTQRGVVTWTAMISGYVQNSQYKEALDLFLEMQVAGVPPNKVTIVSVLPAVTELGALDQGRWIHAYLDKMGVEVDSVLASALVDMYSNCGCIGDAIYVFEKLEHKELSAWNSIISGLAAHGRGRDALHLFYRMQDDFQMIPNDVTFTAILSACSHAGLVEEGRRLFHLFTEHYRLKPNIRHYGCMVDVLARAGCLKEAVEFVETMPVEPNSVIWKSLISACRIHKNVGLADRIWRKITESGLRDSGACVLMSNILKDVGRPDDAGKVRKQMNDLQVKKVAGCSWLELDGVIHEFLTGRESFHAQGMQIRSLLYEMQEMIKLEEYNIDNLN